MMYKVQLGKFIITVDKETADNLKDSQYAKQYLTSLKSLTKDNVLPVPEQVSLWKSSKKPTQNDHRATLALLSLRKQFELEFKYKTTSKRQLWHTIASTMNNDGFFVGSGIEGREKVRQKFANLQASYIKYRDLCKQTGEGKVKPPTYYSELDDILGDKDKANPCIIIDSEEETPTVQASFEHALLQPSCSSSSPSSVSDAIDRKQKEGRFSHIKRSARGKLTKENAFAELLQLQKQSQERRTQEFNTMVQLIREESSRRHEQIMAIINNCSKSKKLKLQHKSKSDKSDSE